MKVKEIMTREVTSITPETNAGEALDLLWKMQISGLPVIDDKNKLVGMFTEKEVLTFLLPSYIEKVGIFVYREGPKALQQKIVALRNIKVENIMRKDVVTVDEDTVVYEVAHIMLTQKVRRLPVLNQAKEVVGIIARGDVLKALCGEESHNNR